VVRLTSILCGAAWLTCAILSAQQAGSVNGDPPRATFKSAVDLVSVAAVVHDSRGRVVRDLSRGDFQVFESGSQRPIVDFSTTSDGPVSVALLFDVSGSMVMGTKLRHAKHAAEHLVSWLRPGTDEAALYSFDMKLREMQPFTTDATLLRKGLDSVEPFGATSLYDAVAETAEAISTRTNKRRAIIVLSDGLDTSSRMGPEQVSAAASAIDVPVYLIAVADPVDHPGTDFALERSFASPLTGGLADLARWTGGDLFVVSAPAHASLAARQLLSELRHQYLLAFEASAKPGWYRLEIRTKDKDLRVRARTGYFSGQQRRAGREGAAAQPEDVPVISGLQPVTS
jgi:Ca-activated chloride channel family protein